MLSHYDMSDLKSAYWNSTEKFHPELLEELGADFLEQRGNLFLSKKPARKLVWAHATWSDAQIIEIASIGDAVKKLRELSKSPWAHAPIEHPRRATLIEDQLNTKAINARLRGSIDFLEARKGRLGAFALLEPNLMIASAVTDTYVPQNEPQFNESSEAPSRAYLKLWDFFTLHGARPKTNETCLDLGASPGGWTWVLAKLGAQVTSLDRADLAPHVAALKNVRLLKKDAFKMTPEKTDWLFSDVICEPRRLLELVHAWREAGACENFVCTIKFKGETDFKVLNDFLKIEGSHARHLFHNKHEVTWWSLGPLR